MTVMIYIMPINPNITTQKKRKKKKIKKKKEKEKKIIMPPLPPKTGLSGFIHRIFRLCRQRYRLRKYAHGQMS